MRKLLTAILVSVLLISTALFVTSCNPAPTKYTITYDTNGGIISQTTQEVDANDFTLLIPEKAGHTFKGWILNGNYFTEDNLLRSDVTLVADWEVNRFNVTFELGKYGTITGSTTQILPAVGYTLPTVSAIDNNVAKFDKWLLNGSPFDKFSVLNSDITLVASYDVKMYEITYDFVGTLKRDDEILNITKEYLPKSKDSYVLPTVEREGYDFNGWLLNGEPFDGNSDLTSDCTLVADMQTKLYNVYYFGDQTEFETYKTTGTLVEGTYEVETGFVYGYTYNLKPIEDLPNKTGIYTGFYYDNNGEKQLINKMSNKGSWSYLSDVYLLKSYEDDVLTVRYHSPENKIVVDSKEYICFDDVVLVENISSAKLMSNYTFADLTVFSGWRYGNDLITSDEDLQEVLSTKGKNDVVDLYAEFDTSVKYIKFVYNGEIKHIEKIDEDKEYNIPDGLTNLETSAEESNPGYDYKWMYNGEEFTPIMFEDASAIQDVNVNLTPIAYKTSKIIISVWGPENDITMGAITYKNNVTSYSVEIEGDFSSGDKLNEVLENFKIEAFNGYNFKYITTEAWIDGVSSEPTRCGNGSSDRDYTIIIPGNKDEVNLYVYFYFDGIL
ncbi:MAG: InlB B-repeat-containing protein [Clostridia bacterium]|nr:InlB B-repeat-containing protein [Clostridia bacterium]